MTSRQRVEAALNHQQTDRVPIDVNGIPATGIHVQVVYKMRQALKLDPPGTPVKVVEAYQLLGEIEPDLVEVLGSDVVPLYGYKNMFGFKSETWKEWQLPDGTPVLVPVDFNTEIEPDGSMFMYPEGDKSVPPSGVMPKGGNFFDGIVRQEPYNEENPSIEDNLAEYTPIDDDALVYYKAEVDRLYSETDKAIMGNFGGTGFGDIALVPATWAKRTKGIRDLEEWYMSTVTRRDFVYELFSRQCDIALANLKRVHQAVGDKVFGLWTTGTDFGTQRGPFISRETYNDLYAPFHRKVNDWIHANTKWKSLIHSCGGVLPLIDDFIAAGFDALNPVQCSAEGMDPNGLKTRFGARITFWGGGVNTQQTLPFGTVEEVRQEARERIEAFAPGGGFVFAAIHNIQANTPAENVIALFETAKSERL